ncbi:MAG TPA: hypothetical protein VKD66_05780 [Streptosporangiaceae bacterium]|nr:hypothetical protein [Streptosporangiaceae bacterium]
MYTAQAPRRRAPPGRLCVRWRVSLTPSGTSGRRRLAEQHVFAITSADGRISALDLLCSGFVTQADHGR